MNKIILLFLLVNISHSVFPQDTYYISKDAFQLGMTYFPSDTRITVGCRSTASIHFIEPVMGKFKKRHGLREPRG